MTTLTDLIPAVESLQPAASHSALSFDWNEPEPTTNFTFDGFLTLPAIESYPKEEEELSELPANVTPFGPLSSPLSVHSDIGAFFDWSAAAFKIKKHGGILQTRGTENAQVLSGNQLKLGAVTTRPRSAARGQPSAGTFSG
jgi:hypothetical protein